MLQYIKAYLKARVKKNKIKINHSSKKFVFPLFKHLACNLAIEELKALTLIVNITAAIHPAPPQ